MAQYCSIQEAFNLPSVPRKKKGCATKTQEEPFDPYTEQNAREQTLYERFQAGPTESSRVPPPPPAADESALGMRYGPLPVADRKQEPYRTPMTRERGMGGDSGYEGSRKSYASQYSDYDYICSTAGICIDNKSETFQNYETVAPSSSPGTGPARSSGKTCAPLSPPPYEYPLSEEDKARFRKALKVALEEMEDGPRKGLGSAPAPPSRENVVPRPYESRNVDMTKVDGYIDEELESYMYVHDMKPAIPMQEQRVPKSELPKELPGLETAPTASPFVREAKTAGVKIPENFTKKNQIWFDLLLFTASGILIIFLLEQLFKLAMMTGMKKTVEAIEMIVREQVKKPTTVEID